MRFLLILLLWVSPSLAVEKIVCFPERINVDSRIESKLNSAIRAGADGVIFDQWSKNAPFLTGEREAELVARQHRMLDICDSAGVKVWLVSQISSKHNYGDPSAIPLKVMGREPVRGNFTTTEVAAHASGQSGYVQVQAPSSRLYSVRVRVTGGRVRMVWMRDPTFVPDQNAHVVRVDLEEGEHAVECPSLDDTDRWILIFQGRRGNASVAVLSITETSPQPSSVRKPDAKSDREGWYNYLGVAGQGFTWAIGPRLENDATRRSVIRHHCEYLKHEFGRHRSVVATLNWSDEWPNGGHDWSFREAFPSAGAGFAAEIRRWAEIQQQIFGYPGLAFGDMFYREGKYSRACNPRGGGFTDALSHLPAGTPVELIVWDDEVINANVLVEQTKKLAGRPWAIGVYMEGKRQSQVWRQVYDRYRGSPRPDKVVFFGWNHDQFTEEHLRAEFAPWDK